VHPVTVVAVAGPAGNNIIGVALAFNWLDGAGNPTDIDRDAIATPCWSRSATTPG